jgi:hypothetical protein
MKKLIAGFLSVLFFVSCTEEPKSETVTLPSNLPPYVLDIKLVEFKRTDSTNTLLLETTLWNNTKDTLKYLSMSCSWQEVYSFSNPKISIPVDPCSKNTPVIISVIPETNAKTFFKVNLNGISQGSKEKVKLGLKLIPMKDSGNVYSETVSKLRAGSVDILWSNEIQL